MLNYFRIGILSSPHGVRGEISIYPTTDDLDRFRALDICYILQNGEYIPLHVTGVKYKKNMPVLRFEEYNTLDEIERLRGAEIYVDREHAIALDEGEYYMADVIGFDVVSDDKRVGTVEDFFDNEAGQSIYVIKCTDGETKYVLNIPEFVRSIDFDKNIIAINMVKGM